ncbi:MAG: hypothetical protein V4567_07115 [Pseudomonadota bacterium]
MYYEILVNGSSLGVVGHPDVRNMHLSVLVMPDGPEVFATAVCEEAGELWLYDWIQYAISSSDIVEFRLAATSTTVTPRNKYKFKSRAGDV